MVNLDLFYVSLPKYVEIFGFEYSMKHCTVIFQVGIEDVQEMEFLQFLSYMKYLLSEEV